MASRKSARRRAYDIVLYGASGFVGRQTAQYLAHYPALAAKGLRWALAGRNAGKLEEVRSQCGPAARRAGVGLADCADRSALDALARDAHVVLSTAGPFALYGSELVAACVAHATHYVDITGETPWVHGLIAAHHERARKDGTRIIPFCGFDSVPSDLGAWLVQTAMRQRHGQDCVSIKASYSMRGGVNGGTLASALNMLGSEQARAFAQPFLLNPPGQRPREVAAHRDPLAASFDRDFNAWLAPFFMGPINTRVVRRSAALLDYGPEFHYQEYLRVGAGLPGALAARAMSAGMLASQFAMQLAPVRMLAQRLAPGPGSGPSEASMNAGSFRCELVGHGSDGALVRARIADRGDPGNRATTKMVCEAALCLALQPEMLPAQPGVVTPASGLGEVLVARLRAAGMTLEVDP